MIQKLEILNLKGFQGLLELKPCVAVIGPNYSGKTAILEAARLALLGWTPTQGKSARNLFRLSSGSEMVVRAQIDGQKVQRRWTETRGKVSQDQGDELVPPVLVDLSTWLNLTAAERTSNLLAAATITGSPEDTIKRIHLLRVSTPEEGSAKMALMERLNALELDAAEHDANVAQFLDAAIESEKHELKNVTDSIKRISAALQGLAMTKTSQPPNVDSDLGTARAKLSDIEKRLAAESGRIRAAGALQETINQLKMDIKLVQQSMEGLPELEKRRVDLAKKVAEYREIAAKAPTAKELNDWRIGYNKARVELEQSTKEKEQIKKQLRDLEDIDSCPFCKSKNKGWKATITKHLEAHLAEIVKQLTDLSIEFKKEEKNESEIIKLHQAAQDAAVKLEGVQRDLIDVQEILEDASNAPKRLEQNQEKLAAKQRELEALGTVADVDELTAESEGLRRLIVDLERSQKLHIQFMSERATMTKQAEELKGLEASERVIKDAKKILELDREALLESVADSVMARARQFTDGILVGKLEWRNNEPGYESETGRWVSFETFSGTEKALAYAGLSVALASEAKHKVVIIDEMGVMDENTKKTVAQRMVDLTQSKVIDQFICADVDGTWVPPGFQVIETGIAK